jgi:hypothetical protein
VNSEGKVDYLALASDKTVEDYVRWLKTFNPESLKNQNERLAFWINTYNMLTIYGVLSQLRNNPDFAEKGNRSLFQRLRFFWWTKYQIGGRKHSLYQIENEILRKFSDPESTLR